MNPPVMIKLGLANQGADAVFRRFRSDQLKNEPIAILKSYAAQLSLSLSTAPDTSFDASAFDVVLYYMDSDGDKVLLQTRDDWIMAVRETKNNSLKVWAKVHSRAPKEDSSTQTPHEARRSSSHSNHQPDPHPYEVVESLVEILAAATSTAADAVHQHLSEPPVHQHRSTVPEEPFQPPVSIPVAVQNTEPKSDSNDTQECSAVETAAPPLIVHPRHTCDACQANPIVGPRYHAPPDFDLCAQCVAAYTGDVELEEFPGKEVETKKETSVETKEDPPETAPQEETNTTQETEEEIVVPPESKEEEKTPQEPPTVPFIHGRHTCDSCLTTPIVGTRYHAVDMADYDLCADCFSSYKGTTNFEPAELDRDRIFQARWQRRHAKWGARGRCGRPGRHPRCGPPPPGFPPHGPPPHGPPPHGFPPHGPPPRGFPPHGFPPHGPPPHGPPPHGFPPHGPPPHGPPPHGFPPHGFPPHGPPPHGFPPHGPPPPVPDGSDLALMEAIRLSMESLPTEPVAEEPKTMEEPSDLEEAIVRSVEEASKEEADKAAKMEEKVKVKTEVATTETVENDSVVNVAESSAARADKSTEESDVESPGNTSYASEAVGLGEVAEGLGETLDNIASAIDAVVNLELVRTSSSDVETDSEDEPEIVIDAVCTSVNVEDQSKGTEIVEGSDEEAEVESSSHHSWQVVAEDNQVSHDAALGRATQMVGSSLFNSDMERSHENVSTLSGGDGASSVTSVPTLVPSLEPQVSPVQLERWASQLKKLHELGFMDDVGSVEVIERLNAANIGVDSEEEVTVQQVIDELMKGW